MTEFDYEPTGDIQLDTLLQNTQEMIQGNNDFLLPDEMVAGAIRRACDFFCLPASTFIDNTSVCVWPNDADTVFDDVFGFNREQMMDMGITGEDSLTLVYTHECAHRMLQGDDTLLTDKEQELACDFFAGVHAGIEHIDALPLMEALEDTEGGDTHPSGELRAEFIRYGKEMADEMMKQDVPITFEACMERFQSFLSEHPINDEFCERFTSGNESYSHGEQLSFGSGWTKDEYVEKAENCYKEADYYFDKAERSEDLSEKKHNLKEAEKWKQRGDEYMQKAKYAENN